MDEKIITADIPCDEIVDVAYFKKDKCLGAAWLMKQYDSTGEKELITLLDIIVYDSKDRRQGIGDKLMNAVTKMFPKIVTGIASRAGRELCLKHGFTIHKELSLKDPMLMFYEREEK